MSERSPSSSLRSAGCPGASALDYMVAAGGGGDPDGRFLDSGRVQPMALTAAPQFADRNVTLHLPVIRPRDGKRDALRCWLCAVD